MMDARLHQETYQLTWGLETPTSLFQGLSFHPYRWRLAWAEGFFQLEP